MTIGWKIRLQAFNKLRMHHDSSHVALLEAHIAELAPLALGVVVVRIRDLKRGVERLHVGKHFERQSSL